MIKTISQKAQGRAKLDVIDHTGKVVRSLGWVKNLLLNTGLDNLVNCTWADLFNYCQKGTGTTVTSEDTSTGSNTYTQAAQVITRTAGSRDFTTDDVGRLVLWPDGSMCNITGYNSATSVNVDASLTEASAVAVKIYYVNQTALTTYVSDTDSYSTNPGDNSTTDNTTAGTRTLQRVFIFPPETADTTYNELGFSNVEGGATANIRIFLSSGIAVLGPASGNPGEQLVVTYQLVITVSPIVSTSSDGSWLTGMVAASQAGHYIIEDMSLSKVNGVNGITDISDAMLEPSQLPPIGLSPSTTALAKFGQTVRNTGASFATVTPGTYSAGSFQQTFAAVWGLNNGAGTAWRTLAVMNQATGIAAFTYLFSTNQSKDTSHSLLVTLQATWGRILT